MKYLMDGQETERLRFRLLGPGDFDRWLEFFENPEAAGFLGLGEIKSPREQCSEWFRRMDERYSNDLGGMNALIEKASGNLVGQCGLLIQEVDGERHVEIAYSVIPAFWRRGFALEAARKCRDYAFENGFADTLISIIHVDNFRSEGVAVKNGMKKFKQTQFRNMPVHVYCIERSEWDIMQKSRP